MKRRQNKKTKTEKINVKRMWREHFTLLRCTLRVCTSLVAAVAAYIVFFSQYIGRRRRC